MVVGVVVVPVVEGVVVVVRGGVNVTEATLPTLVPGLIPKSRMRSRRACSTANCITTSAFGLSMS